MSTNAPLKSDDLPLHLVDEMASALARLERTSSHAERLAMLGTLTATIIHEMNNLLTPALGYAQAALGTRGRVSGPDQPFTERALERIVSSLTAASKVSDSILRFAAAGDPDARATVQLVVDEAIACVAIGADSRAMNVSASIPADLVAAIEPLDLQQVVMNLLLNACAAVRSVGDGRIRIEGTCADSQISISVSDNGCGIAPERLSGLFAPFNSNGTPGGHGLGLCACRLLVERAGGCIDVQSAPDQGTTFTITLPSASIETRLAG